MTALCKGFGRVWRRWLLTTGVQMFELPGKILMTTINLPAAGFDFLRQTILVLRPYSFYLARIEGINLRQWAAISSCPRCDIDK